MRKSLVLLSAAAVVALGSTAWAGPKDKVTEALIDATSINGTTGVWDNNVTAATVKQGKCKMQIQIKGLPAGLEGENIICVAGADVRSSGLGGGTVVAGNSIVGAAAVSKGKLKIKMDLTQITCGAAGTGSIAFNGGITCYRDDPTYNWATACGSINGVGGMVWLTIPSSGAKGDQLLGLCQGFNAATQGVRIPPPASAILAVQGQSSPELP